jgi:ADP-L-glycero-D-manno-heptose 6-epimerase
MGRLRALLPGCGVRRLLAWLDRFGEKVEAVFHLGAISSTTFNDADVMIANNLNYSIALWRWCAAVGKPLIYASSAATYGDGSAGVRRRWRYRGPQASSPAQPLWLVKARLRSVGNASGGGETRAAAMARAQILQCLCTQRISQGRHDEPCRQELPVYRRGEPIRLFKSHRPDYADGEQRRYFIYVKDCAAVMLWLLQSAKDSGIFNVGSGQARNFRQLMEAVGPACGSLR